MSENNPSTDLSRILDALRWLPDISDTIHRKGRDLSATADGLNLSIDQRVANHRKNMEHLGERMGNDRSLSPTEQFMLAAQAVTLGADPQAIASALQETTRQPTSMIQWIQASARYQMQAGHATER